MELRGIAAGALVAGAGALAAGRRVAARRAAEWEGAHPAEESISSVDGLEMHHIESGEGPAVVLIHGSPGVLADMHDPLKEPVGRFARTISYDRPGWGWSERP